jgi:prepilin-type N-terminal cleavage/methylation domain-containing protein
MNLPNLVNLPQLHRSIRRGKRARLGFTLVELLVVVVIIATLAALSFTGYQYARSKVQMARTLESMRQLATGTLLYSQDHNGYIPRGDEGADGAGLGGRGIIWINHIAPNIGYPELETRPLNQSREGMDQWTWLLTKYKSAPFVCGGLDKTELAKTKAKTPDAIGGIGYNVQPLLASVGGSTVNNASWGNIGAPISISTISHLSSRCMYASSYDWHLVGSNSRAYNRFGKNKAAMVFWDGSSRLVSKVEYDIAIATPDLR